jgi:RNA-directed DNA polymerase
VDVDLRKFLDTIDHGHFREFLKRRVRDGVIVRLIGKWLNAGVMEEGVHTTPETGAPQGGIMTPLRRRHSISWASPTSGAGR